MDAISSSFPSDFKMTASHGCFATHKSLRAELAASDRYFAKDSPHLDHMLVYRQRKGATSALKRLQHGSNGKIIIF